MEDQLSLVDVHTDTVADTWPLLLRAIQAASFIALDLVRLKVCIHDTCVMECVRFAWDY